MEKRIITNNIEESIKLGTKIGKLLKPGSLLCLNGDLGAGKTAFTKGIALGLDISRPVSSPTFTILKIYEGRLTLYHIDAYRLEGIKQDLGFEEYIEGDGVCVIEWSNLIKDLLPEKYLDISINYLSDNCREFIFNSNDMSYIEILEEL